MTSPSSRPHERQAIVFCSDSPTFSATILLEPDGEPCRWNGAIAYPLFSREEAERVVKWANGCELDVESARFAWVGDTLLAYEWDGTPFGPDSSEAPYIRWRIDPDPLGRYVIGAMSWTWEEVPQAELRVLDGNR